MATHVAERFDTESKEWVAITDPKDELCEVDAEKAILAAREADERAVFAQFRVVER